MPQTYEKMKFFFVLKWQFPLICHKCCEILFVIFVENDVFYILVEFESDRMSSRESAKNGRNDAHGFNCIIINSEIISDDNFLR